MGGVAQRSIIQVITPSRMAGAETLLARMTGRLRERGHRVHVVANRRSKALGELAQAGLEVEALPIGGKFNPLAVVALARAANRAGGQMFHSHLSTASWWCGWVERFGGPPSLGHVHGFTSAIWHRRQRKLVACSNAVREHLIESGIAANRVAVLHNPVDPEDMTPRRSVAEVRAEMATDGAAPVIGSFAHFSEKKGWRDLIAAAPAVLRKHPTAIFWCVGDGPLRQELDQRTEELGHKNSFRFPGFRRDVADLMNAVDIMALPSHREPFGLVYVEAGLLKKPVIACRTGGAPEVVIDTETGFLIPPHSPDDLSNVLLCLLDNRAKATAMGLAGCEHARDVFGWGRFLEGLEMLYSEVLEV